MSPTTALEPTALGELRSILELVPSPLNPRQHFDKAKLEELAASITSKGIIEPLIVRTRPGFGQLEIVAGERRYRAAKLAKHDLVPVIIRTLSDVEVLELMAIENSQRDDLHPLEEAAGFKALMKADGSYTPKAIAAKIGKSERYVQQRLHLGQLAPPVQKAFLDDQITAGHADLISRLKSEDQPAALKACFANLYGEDKERGAISVRALDRWIEANIRLTLDGADPQTAFFPELADTVADASKILQVAANFLPEQAMKGLTGVLPASSFKQIDGKKDRCEHAERAVVVIGTGRGRLVDICRARTTCKKHFKYEIEGAQVAQRSRSSSSKTQVSPQAKAAAKKAADERKAAQARSELRTAVLEAAMKRFKQALPKKPVDALLPLIARAVSWDRAATTWGQVAYAAAERVREDCFGDTEYRAFAKMLKPLGVDVAALEKELAPTPAQTSAASGGKKKKGASA